MEEKFTDRILSVSHFVGIQEESLSQIQHALGMLNSHVEQRFVATLHNSLGLNFNKKFMTKTMKYYPQIAILRLFRVTTGR